MILKLLIEFYRWLCILPPLKTSDESIRFILFGALIDVMVLVGIIGRVIFEILDMW